MEPMDSFEFCVDLDSVEGAVIDGSATSTEAWALVAGDLRASLVRPN
jgi:hypothetical protein